VVQHVSDVAVVAFLLGTAQAEPEVIAAIHGPRLERMVEKLVDTPVRGILYEGAGTVPPQYLEAGKETLRAASERWRIPVRIVEVDPAQHHDWLQSALSAARSLV
jgi:hypothetical protein